MTVPAHVLAAVRSIPHPRQEPNMTAPHPSPAEQAVIERFGIFEPEEHVERVAQAMHRAVCLCDQGATNIDRKMAAAAIAALPPSPAEEAVKRVEALHKPFGIYTECDHDHDEADIENDLAFEVMEVGTVCEDGLMYRVCQSCCTGDGYQTEECVTNHEHGKDEPICPTVAALASPAPAPRTGEH